MCAVNENLRLGGEVRARARDWGVTTYKVMVKCRKWVSLLEGVCK